MKNYTASCHCQKVKISFETEDLKEALECNCSHCSKKGFLLTFIPKKQATSISGETELTEYRFNKGAIRHLFCKICGIQVYAESKMNDEEMLAINLRTVDDLDLEALKRNPYNGKDY